MKMQMVVESHNKNIHTIKRNELLIHITIRMNNKKVPVLSLRT